MGTKKSKVVKKAVAPKKVSKVKVVEEEVDETGDNNIVSSIFMTFASIFKQVSDALVKAADEVNTQVEEDTGETDEDDEDDVEEDSEEDSDEDEDSDEEEDSDEDSDDDEETEEVEEDDDEDEELEEDDEEDEEPAPKKKTGKRGR